jgi:hypothetical protein
MRSPIIGERKSEEAKPERPVKAPLQRGPAAVRRPAFDSDRRKKIPGNAEDFSS